MVDRPALHDLLCEVLGGPFPDKNDPNHCYFEPPDGKQLHYPCIVYHQVNDLDFFADNLHYIGFDIYNVTIIDDDPDSKIPKRFKEKFQYCSMGRKFASEGLSHFPYTLYYNGPRLKEEENNESN